MAGYVRQSSAEIVTDEVINASDFNNEYNALQSAFDASTGHTHGGGTGEGAPITALGPAQDVTISGTVLGVKTNATVDLGATALRFANAYFAGDINTSGTVSASVLSAATINSSGTINISGTSVLARSSHTGTQTLSTISDAGTMASQNATAVAITGGTVTGLTSFNTDQATFDTGDQWAVNALGSVTTTQTVSISTASVTTVTLGAAVNLDHGAPTSGYEYTKKWRITQDATGGRVPSFRASDTTAATWPNGDEPDWASQAAGTETRVVAVVEGASTVRMFVGG